MKLFDNNRMINIEMTTGSAPDWSSDFFNAGNLIYNEYLGAYKVEDIEWCVEQANDWKEAVGDFEEDRADTSDRQVTIEEICIRKWYSVEERTGGMEDIFPVKLDATSKEDAIKEAMRSYYHLSRHDQKKVTDFYIGRFLTDEDGDIAMDEVEDYTDLLEIIRVADRIKDAAEWGADDCRELCEMAGMEEAWDAADGETFEQVVADAANKLGVEIF